MTESPVNAAKLWLVEHLHLAKDALHVYVALILFFGSMLLFGWKASGWKPWLLVVAAALAGEAYDLIDAQIYDTAIDLRANWKDVWNTLFWPTAIMLLARHTRVLRR